DNLAEYRFYISSDNFTSYWYWSISAAQLKNDTWVPITLSFGEATAEGTPDRSAINAIQWRVKDDGTAITANWNGLSLIAEPTEGIVSLIFDDGSVTQYTEARKKMDEYGFPGTAYIIPDLIDTSIYMTLTQLKNLQNLAGWDIAGHHQTNLTTLTATEVEN
ncbi:unnamed protein product, partial [marine sediment metagenome]